jgi:UDP-N-acetylmuramoyl-L-alanyl-D-glutamate--2,6-diaminopimelate ligase
MENYFQAKSRLFMGLKKRSQGNATAIINTDDPRGKELAKLVCKNVVTYGLKDPCNIKAKMIQAGRTGIRAKLVMPSGETEIRSPLIGKFNIYNILAAAAAAYSMGIDMETVRTGISRLEHIPGRLEMVKNSQSLTIVVDYAHTPDALDKVLKALRPLVSGRLITLFGCGGDRDSGKRYEMGRVAGTLSDMVFITTDNPRTEDPYSIASQIKKGVQDVLNGSRCIVDLDRKSAIKRAVKTIDKNDLLLIAGKGHEDYQIIGKHKKIFDDRIVALKAAAERI